MIKRILIVLLIAIVAVFLPYSVAYHYSSLEKIKDTPNFFLWMAGFGAILGGGFWIICSCICVIHFV